MNHLASLWIGNSFSSIEQMCATSILAQGNPLIVYTYEKVENIPKGVEIRDANEILSTKNILRYGGNGSPALHSDLFRYAMLSKSDYTWVDLDLVALQSFKFSTEFVFGCENSTTINNAVLGLPKYSRTLVKLREYDINTRGYPAAIKPAKRLKIALLTFGRGRHISNWSWGATGPSALTHYLTMSGEDIHALPKQTFYPIPWQETRRFLMPDEIDESDFLADTYAVHLWNKHIKTILEEELEWKIPVNSFIGKMMLKYDIDCELVR